MKNKIISLLFVLALSTGCNNISSTSTSSISHSSSTRTSTSSLQSTNSNNSSSSNSSSNNDYGELVIPDMKIYTGFPDAPQPIFTNPDYACEITYTLEDGSSIEFNDGYFSAVDADLIYVDATTEYHSTTFEVESIKYSDPGGTSKTNFYLSRVDSIENPWVNAGKPKGGTLFVGDSFFDTEFFSNFYDIFKDGNTFTHGVSSSTTTDWEIFSSRLLYPVAPKNLVMHLGTNNLFDDRENAVVALDNTQRLLESINSRLPNTQIYYFAVEPRTYGIGTSVFNQYSYDIIKQFNDGMESYCDDNDYVTFLDATSYCYTSGINVNSSFFRDGCHPKLSNYSVYLNLLKEAGLELNINNEFDNTTEFEIASSKGIASTNNLIAKNGKYITNNYAVSGKFRINETGTNSHIQFSLDSSNANNRFLLWDDDSNGTLCASYAINGNHNPSSGDAICKANEEHIWEVITTSKNSYFYIDGYLEFVFINICAKEFMIGAENTNVSFYDIKVITDEDIDKWSNIINSNEISKYEADTTNVVRAIVV